MGNEKNKIAGMIAFQGGLLLLVATNHMYLETASFVLSVVAFSIPANVAWYAIEDKKERNPGTRLVYAAAISLTCFGFLLAIGGLILSITAVGAAVFWVTSAILAPWILIVAGDD